MFFLLGLEYWKNASHLFRMRYIIFRKNKKPTNTNTNDSLIDNLFLTSKSVKFSLTHLSEFQFVQIYRQVDNLN